MKPILPLVPLRAACTRATEVASDNGARTPNVLAA